MRNGGAWFVEKKFLTKNIFVTTAKRFCRITTGQFVVTAEEKLLLTKNIVRLAKIFWSVLMRAEASLIMRSQSAR